jgi:hypothetical protein
VFARGHFVVQAFCSYRQMSFELVALLPVSALALGCPSEGGVGVVVWPEYS